MEGQNPYPIHSYTFLLYLKPPRLAQSMDFGHVSEYWTFRNQMLFRCPKILSLNVFLTHLTVNVHPAPKLSCQNSCLSKQSKKNCTVDDQNRKSGSRTFNFHSGAILFGFWKRLKSEQFCSDFERSNYRPHLRANSSVRPKSELLALS